MAILNNVSTPPVEKDTATKDEEGHCESNGNNNNLQLKQQTTINNSSIKHTLASKISSSSVEDRCALVSREVLLRLRLDIVTKPILSTSSGNDVEEIDNDTSSSSKETLVYSSEQTSSTVHPKWDHVDEYLSTLFNEEDKAVPSKNCNVLYARFVILSDTTNDDNNPSSVDIKECILAEIPLHPSKLRRLPTITSNDDQDTNNNNNNTSMIIPNPLPPNTILLHYNDGYTRTVPNIYWTLVQRGIICESIVDPVIKRYGSGEEYATTGESKDIGDDDRFEDKAFNVLPDDGVESKLPETSDVVKLDESYSSNQQGDQDTARDNSQTTEDKVFDLLGKAEGDNSKAQPIQGESDTLFASDPIDAPNVVTEESPIGERSTEVQSEENEEIPHGSLPQLPPLSISAESQTTQDEIEELRRMIKMEQHLLEEEQRSIQQVSVLYSVINKYTYRASVFSLFIPISYQREQTTSSLSCNKYNSLRTRHWKL